MKFMKLRWWERFQKYYSAFPELGLVIALGRMNVKDALFATVENSLDTN